MVDPLTASVSSVAPGLMLFVIIAIPIMLVGILVFLFVMSKFNAWAIVEYGYESKNDLANYKVKYSRDRSFLLKAGIPGLDRNAGFPIPVSGNPIRVKGKPAYRFYSPEPGIFIPVSLALDRVVNVRTGEKDDKGKEILQEMRLGDLIPKIGFEARQAFGESYSEAEKLFVARNKMMQLFATWAPIIIFVALMLIVIIMLGNLTSNLQAGVTVQCVTEAITEAGGQATANAPFFA